MNWILKGILGTVLIFGAGFVFLQLRYPGEVAPEVEERLSSLLGQLTVGGACLSFGVAWMRRSG